MDETQQQTHSAPSAARRSRKMLWVVIAVLLTLAIFAAAVFSGALNPTGEEEISPTPSEIPTATEIPATPTPDEDPTPTKTTNPTTVPTATNAPSSPTPTQGLGLQGNPTNTPAPTQGLPLSN